MNLASKSLTGDDWAMSSALPLRDALHDVEHHDVAEFFEPDEMSQRAADLAGSRSTQSCYAPWWENSLTCCRGARPRGG